MSVEALRPQNKAFSPYLTQSPGSRLVVTLVSIMAWCPTQMSRFKLWVSQILLSAAYVSRGSAKHK